MKKTLALLLIYICFINHLPAQGFDSWDFPPGASPLDVGKKVTERYISEPFRSFDGSKASPSEIIYPESCTWFGALKFTGITGDTALLRLLEERFLPLLGSQKELMQVPDHVDHTVFGAIPLQLYLQTNNKAYYYTGIDFADRQWQLPGNEKRKEENQRLLENGLSWQTRFWIDDMFMITTIQSQAYLASKDEKYINRAAYQMTVYLDSLQQANGLFFHAPSAPFYWCRGNGWMATGMADLLLHLPEDNPDRPKILDGYVKMMTTLKNYQQENGIWGQLIDDPFSWSETSGSAMITYAMIVGVKKGWLETEIFAPIVREAWLSLITYIDENNDIREVCQGTNIGFSREYYLNRNRLVGDLHGQAPLLWCATAFLDK